MEILKEFIFVIGLMSASLIVVFLLGCLMNAGKDLNLKNRVRKLELNLLAYKEKEKLLRRRMVNSHSNLNLLKECAEVLNIFVETGGTIETHRQAEKLMGEINDRL